MHRQIGFNSRTRVGCDSPGLPKTVVPKRFNSRTRVGCDSGTAPAGAEAPEFQFTHPRRVRRGAIPESGLISGFQFTHPRRVRLIRHRTSARTVGFNSRTRVGCDLSKHGDLLRAVQFQFTHPRRVRRGHNQPGGNHQDVSIHAPA